MLGPALIDCTRDGVVIPAKQRPKDGHFPVGPEFHDPQPSSHGQQHHLSSFGPVNGDPAFPGELPMIGLACIGTGPVPASSYDNFCPGGLCLHAPSPGKPTLSFDQMMLRCSDMMELLIQQQHQLQQALSRMAAAPFSSIQPAHDIPQQHQIEVKSTAPSCPVPCQPTHISEPHDCLPMCHNSSVPALIAGRTICDVTSDDHHPQKHANVGKPLSPTDEVASGIHQFQPKPANPSGYQITEASASTTAQNGTPADVIDQHLEKPNIRSASYAAYGAAQKELDRQKQVNIILNLLVVCQQKYSSPINKVEASANGSLWMYVINGLRLKQGILVSYFGHLPPWPPPMCISNLPEPASIKIRGGRNIIKSILVAISKYQTTRHVPKPSARVEFNRQNPTVICVSRGQSFPSAFFRTIAEVCSLITIITSLAVSSKLQRAQHRDHKQGIDLPSPSSSSTSTFSCLFTSMVPVRSMVVELHQILC